MAKRPILGAFLLALLAAALAGCAGGIEAATGRQAPPAPSERAAAAPTQAPLGSAPAVTSASPTNAASRAGSQRHLLVFAAASLTESFNDLSRQFEAAHPGVKIVLNSGGSQQLSAQLVHGAPADVFASANNREMLTAISGGAVVSGTQRTFAQNRLAVIFPKDNPGKIRTLADLTRPGLKLDVADKSVPVGQYTLSMLAKMSEDPAYGADFQSQVLKNVLSYENDVKAVVSKVRLGEADAGVVYTTDASAAADKLGSLAIPDGFNQIATYPIAPIANAPQPELARQFVELVLSPAGQQTLTRYGFIPSPGPAVTPPPS